MVDWIARHKWWFFGIIVLGGVIWFAQQQRISRENSQDEVILAAAARHGVPAALVKAVVWQESRFDPRAEGTQGELGLMQIMEPTAQDWAKAEQIQPFEHHHLKDPAKNTQCGAWYLSRLLARYRHRDNPLPYALAAYNAGPTRVYRWSKGAALTNSAAFLEQMDFPGTKKYVALVTKRYRHYKKIFPKKS